MSERIRDYLARTAADVIRNGFGDLSAPLAPGEYVHSAQACPHAGCDWLLPMEWRSENRTEITRTRGLIEADQLAQAHLEEHVAENWKAGES